MTTASYQRAIAPLLQREGGYSNDPVDRGGETWRGISRVMHPEWIGWGVVDAMKSSPGFPVGLHGSAKLAELVSAFYKEQFWDAMSLDSCPSQRVAEELFDTAVNMGARQAKTFYIRSLNVLNRGEALYQDSPSAQPWASLHARARVLASKGEEGLLTVALNVLQGARYIDLMERNPPQERFARGWLLHRITLAP